MASASAVSPCHRVTVSPCHGQHLPQPGPVSRRQSIAIHIMLHLSYRRHFVFVQSPASESPSTVAAMLSRHCACGLATSSSRLDLAVVTSQPAASLPLPCFHNRGAIPRWMGLCLPSSPTEHLLLLCALGTAVPPARLSICSGKPPVLGALELALGARLPPALPSFCCFFSASSVSSATFELLILLPSAGAQCAQYHGTEVFDILARC